MFLDARIGRLHDSVEARRRSSDEDVGEPSYIETMVVGPKRAAKSTLAKHVRARVVRVAGPWKTLLELKRTNAASR